MGNNNKKIVKLFYFLAGDPNKYELKHRIFNISTLSSAFVVLTGTIVNFALNLNLLTTLLTFFLFILFASIYLISIKFSKYKTLLPIYIFFTFLMITVLWFVNAGSKGPTAFAFLLFVFVFNLITEGFFRKVMNALVFIALASMLSIEHFYPEIIINYDSEFARFTDYSFTVLFEMLVMILISSYFIKSFYDDKKLTEQQRDEIQDKNEEISITQQELIMHKDNLEELVQKRTIELEYQKIQAQTSDKLKTAFLSNMSHEIRTPMNAIIGFSKLLKTTNLDEQKKDEYVDIIINKGHLLLNLINDVLDIAKIEANELSIKQEACNLNEILNDVYESFTQSISTNIDFTITESQENTIIKSDSSRIKQIMLNLVSNAIKFTNDGEIKLGFTIIEDTNTVQFFVSDTGIGIPKDKTDMVFDRFRQINETNAKDIGGAGLGLAISKNLANILGGELNIKSEYGKGSTFYLNLPCNRCKKAVVENIDTNSSNYNWENKKILIAEDEEFNFLILHDLLKETKINITRAENGQEVLSILENDSSFNLILLDIQMPHISGYELFKIIKTKHPKIPIFAQTAYVMQEDIDKMNNIGFDSIITKPIDFEKFFNSLDKVL